MSAMELASTLVAQVVVFPIQFIGFWASVSLPLFYVPLLFTGFKPEISIFVALLVIHLISLVVGHGYGRKKPTLQEANVSERRADA
ncbi:hypothetical protein [Haladaptatus caseinilyticus]|uniref:hypothetical protein n=1 Tax=Haladaptatus caseinilyticus TaxID=2993314 RepID=UPI00224A7202|nr:hypothetical protein [Haladaptatus caseinilyticus]